MRLFIALAFAVASTAACMEGPFATVSPSPTVGRIVMGNRVAVSLDLFPA
jgi:hypothetical protein